MDRFGVCSRIGTRKFKKTDNGNGCFKVARGDVAMVTMVTDGVTLLVSVSHHADGLVHVTVAEDDERRLPSQLQRHLLQVAQRTAAEEERRTQREP